MRWMVLVRQLSWFYLAWFVSIGSIVHITVGQCKFIFYIVEVVYRSLPPILYIFTPRPTAPCHIGGGQNFNTVPLQPRQATARRGVSSGAPANERYNKEKKIKRACLIVLLCCCVAPLLTHLLACLC